MTPLLPLIERELAAHGSCDLGVSFRYKGRQTELTERIVRLPDGSLRCYSLNDLGDPIGEHKGDSQKWIDYFDSCGYVVLPKNVELL